MLLTFEGGVVQNREFSGGWHLWDMCTNIQTQRNGNMQVQNSSRICATTILNF